MDIQKMPITELKAADYNPRKELKPGDPEYEKLKRSITEYGYVDPVIWNKRTGCVVGGHQRLTVLRDLGETEVDVVVVDLDLTHEKALNVALNKVSGEWDMPKLQDLLKGLADEGTDVTLTGFDIPEVEQLFRSMMDDGAKEDDFDVDAELEKPAATQKGDLWFLGKHRLLCGDSTSVDDVVTLMGGELADLLLTDPPYNVAYEGKTKDKLKISNDSMADEDFRQFLRDAFTAANAVMKPGAAFYIWHADSEGYNFRGACKDATWKVRQCLVWLKNVMVMGRQDYQWKHEPCQPAGTMVRTPKGEVPIETLKDGDRVVSFDTYSGSLKGLRDGLEVKTASRHYNGLMYSVSVGDKTTRATDNHEFSVRINPEVKDKYCVYLMHRGNWWRVGTARTYMSRGFGIRERFRQENADEQWILMTCETASEAELNEQYIAVTYGIPYTCWEAESRRINTDYNVRSKEQIEEFYSRLDLDKLDMNANLLLAAYGRNREYPLITKEKFIRLSRRVTAKINACNLIPGLMQVPLPFAGYQGDETFKWADITKVTFEPFDGTVYSLAVDKFKHYISDGIVTHNCLYGWKDGGAHVWYSDRKQTTVLEFDRPTRSKEHPTMKPIPLFDYQIKNSTRGGDRVLDLFGGSGTTIMACEQNGRMGYSMELDPKYCDVIVNRYIELTGSKEGVKVLRDGLEYTYDEVQPQE